MFPNCVGNSRGLSRCEECLWKNSANIGGLRKSAELPIRIPNSVDFQAMQAIEKWASCTGELILPSNKVRRIIFFNHRISFL